jgi:hypothetical protein
MFKIFGDAVHRQYNHIAQRELFIADVADIFESYLAAFPEGSNPIFRERTVHDCNCCKNFIRRLGVLVAINPDGTTASVWDDLDLPEPYKTVADRMSGIVRQAPIRTVFRSKERSYGVEHNYAGFGMGNERYEHFHGLVDPKHYTNDPATKRGAIESAFQVLNRGLREINASDLEQVIDLIDNNGLYRGEEYKGALTEFLRLKRAFDGTKTFVWAHVHDRAALFRNTVIGTLLVDLAEGKDFERAIIAFEAKMAPQNYKRPTALITQRMVDDAVKTLKDLDLEGAIHRRYARFSDVSVNNVLFVDNSVRGVMKDGIAGLLEDLVKPQTTDPKKATTVTVDNFYTSILPGATSLGLFLENRHLNNFVSLTGGDGPERLFRWNNNFAWSYDGEVADSVKQRVKRAGGNIHALLRVSLAWYNYDDLDIHCWTPKQHDHIYYGNKLGILDVDMNAAGRRDSRTPVENLAFTTVKDGIYKIWVNNYSKQESIDVGFEIEVEFGGVIHQFRHPGAVTDHADAQCFDLVIRDGRLSEINITGDLIGGALATEKWSVKTESLISVHALMNSPNHWDGQSVGNKHWFFMLKNCKNPDPTRGIYNEFLRSDLEKHRKVFEVLGSKTKCPPSDDQISGLGFTSARGDTVTIVVNGRRAYNVTF